MKPAVTRPAGSGDAVTGESMSIHCCLTESEGVSEVWI
jgi:hypothetical protein